MPTCNSGSGGGGKGKGGGGAAKKSEATAMSKKVSSNFSESIEKSKSVTALTKMSSDIDKNTYLTKAQKTELKQKIEKRIDSLKAEKKATEKKSTEKKKAETKKAEPKKTEAAKTATKVVTPKVTKPKAPKKTKKESTKITEKQYGELAKLAKEYGIKATAKDMKAYIRDWEDDYNGGRRISYAAARELIYNRDIF